MDEKDRRMSKQVSVYTVTMRDTIYCLAAPEITEEEFLAKTMLDPSQFIVDVIAKIALRFGWRGTRGFGGSVYNEVMPLCDYDPWSESTSREKRTWFRDGIGYRFYPLTSADLRTVTRFGRPAIYLHDVLDDVPFCYVSRGEDGAVITRAALVQAYFDRLLDESGLIVQRDSDELRGYIDDDGILTY